MNINPDNEQPVCLYRCLCTRVDHRGGMVVEGVSSGGFPFVELGLKETKRFPFPSVDHVHIYWRFSFSEAADFKQDVILKWFVNGRCWFRLFCVIFIIWWICDILLSWQQLAVVKVYQWQNECIWLNESRVPILHNK